MKYFTQREDYKPQYNEYPCLFRLALLNLNILPCLLQYIFFKEIKQHVKPSENYVPLEMHLPWSFLWVTTLLNSGYGLSMQTLDYKYMIPVFSGLAGFQGSFKWYPVCELLHLRCFGQLGFGSHPC